MSVLHDRGPLARLRELGGQVIFDETNGYGHPVWDYKEGNERGAAWELLKVRPASRTVRRIDYTAIDGGAMRGWWGEIAEWGAAPKLQSGRRRRNVGSRAGRCRPAFCRKWRDSPDALHNL